MFNFFLFGKLFYFELYRKDFCFYVLTAQKKWSFPLRISPVNVTKSAVSSGFGHICWRILNGELHFFVQWLSCFFEFSFWRKLILHIARVLSTYLHQIKLNANDAENQSASLWIIWRNCKLCFCLKQEKYIKRNCIWNKIQTIFH